MVHIAGTNGKGSTLAMLDAMLRAGGRRVQRYISPHLVRFNERILFDGRPIAEAELAEVLDVCERVNDGAPITFFEITTAAAFLAFARHPADAVLLETGLGGRLDATNVIARPRLTALAPDLARSPGLSRRASRADRVREGRHPEARRALHRGAAASRGAERDRAACPSGRRAAQRARPGLAGAPDRRPAGGVRRRRRLGPAAAGARGPSSDRQCRPGGRVRAGARRPRPGRAGARRRPAQRRMARRACSD